MPSFDVISKINYQEFDNALANCLREISNRYDFKGLNITIERKDKSVIGYNIGTNSGKVAGQTIMHCHIHLIPRRKGDVLNPQGGVRAVIPSKQHYIRKNK